MNFRLKTPKAFPHVDYQKGIENMHDAKPEVLLLHCVNQNVYLHPHFLIHHARVIYGVFSPSDLDNMPIIVLHRITFSSLSRNEYRSQYVSCVPVPQGEFDTLELSIFVHFCQGTNVELNLLFGAALSFVTRLNTFWLCTKASRWSRKSNSSWRAPQSKYTWLIAFTRACIFRHYRSWHSLPSTWEIVENICAVLIVHWKRKLVQADFSCWICLQMIFWTVQQLKQISSRASEIQDLHRL